MSNRFPIRLALVFVMVLQVSHSLLAQRTRGIAGSMMTSRGETPDHAVRVTLEARGSVIGATFSDSAGKFSFAGLSSGFYHTLVNDEKYRPIDESVEVDPAINDPTIVRLILVPKESAHPESPAPGKNPSMAGSAELKQFPKPALKEFEKGVKAAKDGRTDEAIVHYQKAIKLAPDLYLARNNLGTAYLGQSQFAAAREEFEQVIKINPSDAAAYFNLGNLFLMTGKYEDAAHWLDQGLGREPNNALGHFLVGVLCTRTGNVSRAEKELRAALQLDPKTSKAHLALVNLYRQQGRTADAADELRHFLKDFPNDPDGLKAQEVLQKLEAQMAAKTQNP
jgi:tetratricopeptide (TPR) repeat protein